MVKYVYRKLILPIVTAKDTPEAVARGAAMGMGIGLLPLVGIQMPLAWIFATLFRANRVVAVAMVWISNPLTVLPMYYVEYRLGTLLLELDAISSYTEFADFWNKVSAEHPGYLDRILALSETLGYPLLIGSVIPTLGLGIVSYPITLWWLRSRQRASRVVAEPVAVAAEDRDDDESGRPSAGSGAVEPNADSKESEDMDGGGGRRVVALFVCLLACVGCESRRENRPHASRDLQDEATHDGERVLFCRVEDQTLVTVGPYHFPENREAFSKERFDQWFGFQPDQARYLELAVYCFNVDQPLEFGEDGVAVTVATDSGRLSAEDPSNLLERMTEAASRLWAGSLLGIGELPSLETGQFLRLLLVFEVGKPGVKLDDVRVAVRDESWTLEPRRADIAAMDVFRSRPSLARFENALVRESG